MDDPLFDLTEKVCCTCKVLKPLEEFNRLAKAKDGRQYSCRDCNKAYHYANWDRHMSQIRSRAKARRRAAEAFIIAHLQDHPCVDCGESDIVVLEFDHLRDKSHTISRMIQREEIARIAEEITKCEVVCANCHRRRTARRGRWYRTLM